MKYIQILVAATLFFVNIASLSFAREVTLYWEPSPSPDVAGYKVYYQQNSPQLPLAGTGADQGASPIDVQSSLMATISGLQESVTYYFSVTAYDSNNTESSFSNIVATAWMPPLRSPQKESLVIPWNVTFEWAGLAGQDLNYTLYYGTDEHRVNNAGIVPYGFGSSPRMLLPVPAQGLFVVIVLMLLLSSLLIIFRADRPPVYISRAAVAGLFIFTLVACGEGGGSGWSGAVSPSSTALTRIDTGTSTSYQASTLESGTTYYWKVDAHSTSDPDTVFHSEMYSFTTQ